MRVESANWENGEVTSTGLYSDRTNGPAPRDKDALPDATARGLLNLVQTKIDTNWFAKIFPEHCYDGQGITGTNERALGLELQALIPELDFPLLSSQEASDEAILDLIEYSASRVAEPADGPWHSFFKHNELSFDEKTGRRKFRDEVNLYLSRGRTTYELSTAAQVQRIGTPEVRQALADLRPNSGDGVLDDLIIQARTLYVSHRVDDRKTAIEKLWDAFERLKTIDIPGGNKKSSLTALLAHITDEPLRATVEADMFTLTGIGNTFNIRHHETGKYPLTAEGYDYFFARMSNVIIVLLRQSDRLD
jgi:hypothetical protein